MLLADSSYAVRVRAGSDMGWGAWSAAKFVRTGAGGRVYVMGKYLCIVLCCVVLCCIVLYCIVLYCIVLYCIVCM